MRYLMRQQCLLKKLGAYLISTQYPCQRMACIPKFDDNWRPSVVCARPKSICSVSDVLYCTSFFLSLSRMQMCDRAADARREHQ